MLNDNKNWMKEILLKKRLSEIIEFFDKPNWFESQKDYVEQIKEQKASSNIGIGFVIIGVSVLISIYGFIDVFTDALLPFGGILLILSPVGFCIGLYKIFSNFWRLNYINNTLDPNKLTNWQKDLVERQKELAERYKDWSTEDLVQAVTTDKLNYRPEANEALENELRNRNVSIDEYQDEDEIFPKNLQDEEWTKCSINDPLKFICFEFYQKVFGQKLTDFTSKEDQIIDVCQFIPFPVLEIYEERGWKTYMPTSEELSPEKTPIECSICHKKADNYEQIEQSIPVLTQYREDYRNREPEETKRLIENIYLKCNYCGNVMCYECTGYAKSKETRFLCHKCGKATNGWEGLAKRWMNVRELKTHQDDNFILSLIKIYKRKTCDNRVFEVIIILSGHPFDSLRLVNYAFEIDNQWFLLSPEPILTWF